jgi:hypothetical protein
MAELGVRTRWEARAALELFTVCGFAIAQPLLSLYGRSPDALIYHDATPRQVVLFAVVIAVLPPLVFWCGELVIGLFSTGIRKVVHFVLLIALAELFAIQLMKHYLDSAVPVVLTSVLFVSVGAVLYARTKAARSWMLFASPASVFFVVMFVFASSVTPIVFPSEVHAAELGSAKHAPSVVMVLFDEWPTTSFVDTNGNINRALFPNLAAFARTSNWYRNATTLTNSTTHAVPTILTGSYPKQGDLPEASAYPRNLFTFLGGSYRLQVNESVTRLCPPELCTDAQPAAAAGGLRGLLDDAVHTFRAMVSPSKSRRDITTGFQETSVESVVDTAKRATKARDTANTDDLGPGIATGPLRFTDFLRDIRTGERSTVHFLHILLPHVTHRFLPNGDEYAYPIGHDDFAKPGERLSGEQWPVTLAQQRMMLQAQYADALVGALLTRLRATHNFDRSVVVLTADHGIVYKPGAAGRGLDKPAVPQSSYGQLLWAPLFVKAANQHNGVVSDANVMSIDVVPTIAKLTGFTLPWKVDGVPAGTRATPTKLFMKSTANAFGVSVAKAISYDGRAGERAMVAEGVSAFAPSTRDPTLQLYRVGRYASLIGTPVAAATVDAARAAGTVRTQQLAALANLESVHGKVPALVWGSAPAHSTIAFAVNGTIAGVSPTFRDGDEPNRIAVLLPEKLLHVGNNHLAAYRVDGGPSHPVLHPIALRG